MVVERREVRVGLRWVIAALGLYAVWTGATWALEGRIHTLLRPAAVADRMIYVAVANLAVGVLGGLWLVRLAMRATHLPRQRLGFWIAPRAIAAALFGGVLGLSAFLMSKPVHVAPMVAVNAYAQVMTVTVAEVVVCWVALGGMVREWLRPKLGPPVSGLIAIAVCSVAFGAYHFAHSPPFDTWPMVGTLVLVGAVTGVVFFAFRSLYAAVFFHNFLGMRGVLEALARADRLGAYAHPLWPALGTGLLMLLALVVADGLIVRSKMNLTSGSSRAI